MVPKRLARHSPILHRIAGHRHWHTPYLCPERRPCPKLQLLHPRVSLLSLMTDPHSTPDPHQTLRLHRNPPTAERWQRRLTSLGKQLSSLTVVTYSSIALVHLLLSTGRKNSNKNGRYLNARDARALRYRPSGEFHWQSFSGRVQRFISIHLDLSGCRWNVGGQKPVLTLTQTSTDFKH